MTRNTNRNDIEPVFRRIAEMMMILFCLLRAKYTLSCMNFRQFMTANSGKHGEMSFSMKRIMLSIFHRAMYSYLATLFCFAVSPTVFFGNHSSFLAFVIFLTCASMSLFALCCLLIGLGMFFFAGFTPASMPILIRLGFVKFAERLYFSTFGTMFCYALLRHDRFSNKRLCLEPGEVRPSFGSLYCRRELGGCQ